MAFDNRQNLYIPKISAEDCKNPDKVATQLNLIADRINALKAPRYIVRRVDSYRRGDKVVIDNVGFNVGGVILGGVWLQTQNSPAINYPTSPGAIFIDVLNISGGSVSFTLDGGFPTYVDQNAIFTFTVLILELDANNNQGATNSSNLAKTLMRRG